MSNEIDYAAVHRLSVKDIKRNYLFWGVVLISFIASFISILYGTSINDKKRWMTYAIFLCITSFSMPLVYYIRYSDKNRKISDVLIYTKIRNVFLYQCLFGFYQTLILALIYGINIAIVSVKYGGGRFDIYLALSVILNLIFLNAFCVLCMNIIKKYYIGLILYIVICLLLLRINNLSIGLFFPLAFENHCFAYFAGKIVEILLVLLFNKIWLKRNYYR